MITQRLALTALFALAPVGLFTAPLAAGEVAASTAKLNAIALVERQEATLVDLSTRIWGFAETALRERRSAAALADYAEQQGFAVTRGVAGMPTAFVATFGSGSPVIGIMGEYDALPGISQAAAPQREALVEGAAGHGCGHNLFGPASLGAAVAIKELLAAGEISGTIRFFGTPAEESVGGKLYMVREGLFQGIDVALAWHPSTETRSDTEGSQALVDLKIEFFGRAAHAAFDPWNGRSAVDGLEIFTHALNLMREHVRPTVRMHYAIQQGGDVPNVIPEYASLWCWLRDSKHAQVDELLVRIQDMAKGAALAAGVETKVTVQSGDYEMLVNFAGQRLVHDNLAWLGPIAFTADEQEFARQIQRATGVDAVGLKSELEPLKIEPGDPEGGSTDVADVSWVVPTLHLSVTTAPFGAPWHAWPVVACGGMSVGQRGMMHAAKALTGTMIDLYQDPQVLAEIRGEFAEKTRGQVYKGYLPPGPPPLPAAAGEGELDAGR